jgi:DNA-binding GntR family transcriptional regulator
LTKTKKKTRVSSGRTTSPATSVADSVTDRVADAITSGIRAGTFVPGQHLPESAITLRLGISRGSLREALRHLAAAGIVTLNRFRGAYISTLDLRSTLDLLETLEPLARLAGRLAAEHCDTSEKRRRIKTVTEAIELAARSHSRAEYLERRRVFYNTLIEIGGNTELARAMPLSRTDLFRAQIERIQSERQRDRHAAGYARIAAAVVARTAAAYRAVQRHFASTRQTMKELGPDSFPSHPRR